jgi:hypothetical protein
VAGAERLMGDEHDEAIASAIAEKGKKTMAEGTAEKEPALLTIEIQKTVREGVYNVVAFDDTGVEIAKIPCLARAAKVVPTVADIIIDAASTGIVPLLGAEEIQASRQSGSSRTESTPASNEDFTITDIFEGFAKMLRKAPK